MRRCCCCCVIVTAVIVTVVATLVGVSAVVSIYDVDLSNLNVSLSNCLLLCSENRGFGNIVVVVMLPAESNSHLFC